MGQGKRKNSLKTESHFPQRGTSQGGGVIDISLLKEWDQKQSSPHTCTPSSLLITCCQELLWGQAGKCASLLGWAHLQSLRRRIEPLKRLLWFSIYQLGSEQAHLKKCCLSTPAGLARVLSKSNRFRICTDSPKRGPLMPKTYRNQGPFLHSTSSSGSRSGLEGDVPVQDRDLCSHLCWVHTYEGTVSPGRKKSSFLELEGSCTSMYLPRYAPCLLCVWVPRTSQIPQSAPLQPNSARQNPGG